MKKFTIWYIAVIFGLILLFFLQNKEFFVVKQKISYNLICIPIVADTWGLEAFKDYSTEIYFIFFFLISFLSGVVLTLFHSFVANFKVKREMAGLNRTIDLRNQRITELENQLEVLDDDTDLEQKEPIDIQP